MAKFNETNYNKTVNKCGHAAYKLDNKTKLVTMVLTTMFGEKKFYGDNSDELVKLAESSDMHFVANLAVFARKEMNLRSVAHVLTCVVARYGKGSLTRYAVNGVVIRPDDITEIMACYKSMYGKPFPNALKRAVAEKFKGFGEYQLAKYNGGNKSIKLRDVLRITHPVPNSKEMSALFKKVLDGNLETPYTWETELSAKGNTKEVWEDLIDSGKVGYMALLRNLRNIIKAKPNNLNKVYQTLADPERVVKSRQLPFRFYSAYRAVDGLATTRTIDTLEDAIKASCDNIETLPGKTLVAIDVSGSMGCPISRNSEVLCRDIACIMGAIATSICEDADVYTFDTKLYKQNLSTRNGIISNAEKMNCNGGGTNVALPFKEMLRTKTHYDRIIILSDNEINSQWAHTCYWCDQSKPVQSLADEYRRRVNPDLWVHAIDLVGYGTTQFLGPKTNILAGWSERVFDFIRLRENGEESLVHTIESGNF